MIARAVLVTALLTSTVLAQSAARRIIIIKVDGMGEDLLLQTMHQVDPETGKSQLPWISRIFEQNGAIEDNFYTRGISLSAPSWSELDTGRHTIIRGNVEYDRYSGHVYDYLNFFPFYVAYARFRRADMPGVEVLDRAGIPLLLDRYPFDERYQSFQLYQRGVRWNTLTSVLKRKFSTSSLLALLEGSGPSLDQLWAAQTEKEVDEALGTPSIRYIDFFTGDVDHEGHASSNPQALTLTLRRLDALCGRLWSAIQASPQAKNTVLVMVSDHGMNNEPGVISQSFSVPDVLASAEGGGHHVITDRHEFADFKLRGLDPLVQRVINPSRASFYLRDRADQYPTAWVDLDGNERASISLRNSDLNKIHVLLLQLERQDLPPNIRAAAVSALEAAIDEHRPAWTATIQQLEEELNALKPEIANAEAERKKFPNKPTTEMRQNGEVLMVRRLEELIAAWRRETEEYSAYIKHLRALLSLDISPQKPFSDSIADVIPAMSLGDNNTTYQLQNYIAGPSAAGLALDASGRLDETNSFVHVDYFQVFAAQHPINNPQKFSPQPVDFAAVRLTSPLAAQVYWLSDGLENQLLILKDQTGRISLRPVNHLAQTKEGDYRWNDQAWRGGLPLHLYEDPLLAIPNGSDRATWLAGWHSEREWLNAIVRCKYSNGVIGITEELSPVADNVPGPVEANPVRVRYEKRRRALVQPDLQIFAGDHWNFNVRNVNPGGNHGSFLRISTHSVWMMSGPGVPAKKDAEPRDSLDFAPCLINLAGFADAPPSFCRHN